MRNSCPITILCYLFFSLAAGQHFDFRQIDSLLALPLAVQKPDSLQTDSLPALPLAVQEPDSVQTDSLPALPLAIQKPDSVQSDNFSTLPTAGQPPDSMQSDSIPVLPKAGQPPYNVQTDSLPASPITVRKPDSAWANIVPSLLILEPVDLASGKTSESMGETLREIFSDTAKWNVYSRRATAEKLLEYNIEITTPCKEFSCAFDAGNMFHSDYVLFSSISRLNNLYAFNLAIIDVNSSRIAWAHTGEIPIKVGRDPDDALVFRLRTIIGKLSTGDFRQEALSSKGVLGIIDYSKSSQYSNLVVERITTHLAASGQFEVMGQSELEFLEEAMEIRPGDTGFSFESVQKVGGKLGLDYLINSRLDKQQAYYLLRLALYDVQAKQMIRDWPVKSKDFRKVLEFESKFCASLNKTQADFVKDNLTPILHKWKWAASSLATVTGLVFTYLAYHKNKKANEAFDRHQSANTLQELDRRPRLKADVKREDRARNLYIIFGGLLFFGGGYLWYF